MAGRNWKGSGRGIDDDGGLVRKAKKRFKRHSK